MRTLLNTTLILMLITTIALPIMAQDSEKKEAKKDTVYQFTNDIVLDHTPIKSQDRTSTCWSFATTSMLESEIIRNGHHAVELSEMFNVYNTYLDKADHYVRMHGHAYFPAGGACHDVIDQLRDHGLMTDKDFSGYIVDPEKHKHSEIHSVLQGMVDGVAKGRRSSPTPVWKSAFEAALKIYLGTPPEKIEVHGKEVTPLEFAASLDLNADDYVEIMSDINLPFYTTGAAQVPDNWYMNDDYLNVPVEDLARIAEHSIREGYTVVYGGDTSSKNFASKKGYAVVPADKDALKDAEEPVEEKEITQAMRQKLFDNFTTGDDHAMHLVGLAKDQSGNVYFYTKNSWGSKRKYDGYLYMSKAYVNLNVTAMMINKKALPQDIKEKFGL
ncbi:aminopeptidase [bacterium]|nr:aminopeptidase [bacterium]